MSNEPDIKLVGLVQSDVVTRKVALAYIVQRLTDGDLASAKTMLLAVAQVCISSTLLVDRATSQIASMTAGTYRVRCPRRRRICSDDGSPVGSSVFCRQTCA